MLIFPEPQHVRPGSMEVAFHQIGWSRRKLPLVRVVVFRRVHVDGQESQSRHERADQLLRKMRPSALLHNPMAYPPVAPPAPALLPTVEHPPSERLVPVRLFQSLPLVVVGGVIQQEDLPEESQLVVAAFMQPFGDAGLLPRGEADGGGGPGEVPAPSSSF